MLYNRNNHTTKSNFNSFNLKKNKKLQEIQYIALPPELTSYYRRIDFREIASYKFGEEISRFAQLMVDKFPSNNLIMLYNNINELKIKTFNASTNKKIQQFKNFILKRGNDAVSVASYSSLFNRISIPEINGEVFLPHELFHMATSYMDENVIFSGFEQRNINTLQNIGVGINEGYTEFMVSKYYGEDYVSKSAISYIILCQIVKSIENIIGQKLYLNANLNGLVNELSLYVEWEMVLKFISAMDYFYNNFDNSFLKSEKKEKDMLEQIKFINSFVISVDINKKISKLKNKEINKEELILYINGTLSKIPVLYLDGKEYNIFPNSEQIIEIIQNSCKKYDMVVEYSTDNQKENNKIGL